MCGNRTNEKEKQLDARANELEYQNTRIVSGEWQLVIDGIAVFAKLFNF